MRKKIVIIDDDQDILELIEYILTEKGFEVITSLSAKILEDLLEINPNLILLDDWLGDTLGHELCRNIKINPETKHIPVIIISAATGLAEISKECFADSYIEKPFDIEHLESKITILLAG